MRDLRSATPTPRDLPGHIQVTQCQPWAAPSTRTMGQGSRTEIQHSQKRRGTRRPTSVTSRRAAVLAKTWSADDVERQYSLHHRSSRRLDGGGTSRPVFFFFFFSLFFFIWRGRPPDQLIEQWDRDIVGSCSASSGIPSIWWRGGGGGNQSPPGA